MSSRGDSISFLTLLGENTPWDAPTITDLAPLLIKRSAAETIVPPVSIISSIIMQILFLTSSTLTSKCSAKLGFGRYLFKITFLLPLRS